MRRPQRRYGDIDDRLREVAVAKVKELMARTGATKTAAAKELCDEFGVHHNTILLWLEASTRRLPTGSVVELEARISRLQEQLTISRTVNQVLTRGLLDGDRTRP